MPDMLVKLYALPDASALYKSLEEKGIRISQTYKRSSYIC